MLFKSKIILILLLVLSLAHLNCKKPDVPKKNSETPFVEEPYLSVSVDSSLNYMRTKIWKANNILLVRSFLKSSFLTER